MKKQYIYWCIIDKGPWADLEIVDCSSVHATRRAAERRVRKIISARHNKFALRLDAKGRMHAESYNRYTKLFKKIKWAKNMGKVTK